MPLEFLDASPHPGQNYDITAFEDLLLTATLGVEPWTDPKRVIVEAWTNIRDRKYSNAGFRAVRLQYQGPAPRCGGLLYTAVTVPVWIGKYSLNFRARERFRPEWIFFGEKRPADIRIAIPTNPEVAARLPLFQLHDVSPRPLETVEINMLEQVVYWIRLDLLPGLNPELVQVQAWTNLRSEDNPDGKMHAVTMSYRGPVDNGGPLYGEREVAVGIGKYYVTYRAKLRHHRKWVWLANESAGEINVGGARQDKIGWAPQLAEAPDYVHLVGPVYLGAESALLHLAESKTSALFSHLLCVADDLQKPDWLPPTVAFHSIPIKGGINNVIADRLIQESVDYIRKICHGFLRAASVAVAFVLAENCSMSYEDALIHVRSRRPSFPHSGLKEAIYRIYPRTGVDTICQAPSVCITKIPTLSIAFVSPGHTDTLSISQFQDVVFYVELEVIDRREPTSITVQAWTNLRTADNPDGEYYGIPLSYRGLSTSKCPRHTYGDRILAAGVGEFLLTYRAKICADSPITVSDQEDWVWVSKEGNGTVVNVGPPDADKSVWSSELQKIPDLTRLIGPIHFGAEAAVLNAPPNAQFTHVLCVAEELEKPTCFRNKVVFHQIPLQNGIGCQIGDQELEQAIDWLREVWEQFNSDDGKYRRAIVYSRYGLARAGSIAVAFVLAENPSMTYEEALGHVTARRPVLPHSGLKESIYRVYPRPWTVSERPLLPNRSEALGLLATDEAGDIQIIAKCIATSKGLRPKFKSQLPARADSIASVGDMDRAAVDQVDSRKANESVAGNVVPSNESMAVLAEPDQTGLNASSSEFVSFEGRLIDELKTNVGLTSSVVVNAKTLEELGGESRNRETGNDEEHGVEEQAKMGDSELLEWLEGIVRQQTGCQIDGVVTDCSEKPLLKPDTNDSGNEIHTAMISVAIQTELDSDCKCKDAMQL